MPPTARRAPWAPPAGRSGSPSSPRAPRREPRGGAAGARAAGAPAAVMAARYARADRGRRRRWRGVGGSVASVSDQRPPAAGERTLVGRPCSRHSPLILQYSADIVATSPQRSSSAQLLPRRQGCAAAWSWAGRRRCRSDAWSTEYGAFDRAPALVVCPRAHARAALTCFPRRPRAPAIVARCRPSSQVRLRCWQRVKSCGNDGKSMHVATCESHGTNSKK